MRLVSFTPLPPAPTGIADYSEHLLTGLKHASIEVEAVSLTDRRDFPFVVLSPANFTLPGSSSAIALYNIGNSQHHDFVYPSLFRGPEGVLVLHDLAIHHARLLAHMESAEVRAYRENMADVSKRASALARIDAYRREVEKAYPARGEAVARIAVRTGGGRLLYDYPLFEDLVRMSRRTFVHSRSARAEILERCPEADVRHIRMGVPLPEMETKDEARRKLGLASSTFILASFGLVTPEKRITTAIRALARLRLAGVDAEYVLVGGSVAHYDPSAEARALGVAEHVHLVGRVETREFDRYAFASDICLNLRYPSAGETSATLSRLLACGRPVVVTDQVHVSDYSAAVVHRTSLEGDEDGLYCDLRDLIASERRRRELASNARAFAEREGSVESMVSDYIENLKDWNAPAVPALQR